jgi:hypothetical protein
MDITMIGLQNAGKTSLLRVLAVSRPRKSWIYYRSGTDCSVMDRAENLPLSMSSPFLQRYSLYLYQSATPPQVLADHLSSPIARFQQLDLI